MRAGADNNMRTRRMNVALLLLLACMAMHQAVALDNGVGRVPLSVKSCRTAAGHAK
jgi:hypothetical protein